MSNKYLNILNEELSKNDEVDLDKLQKHISEAENKLLEHIMKIWTSEQLVMEKKGQTTNTLAKTRLLYLVNKLKTIKSQFKKANKDKKEELIQSQLLILGQISCLTLVGRAGKGLLSKFLLVS